MTLPAGFDLDSFVTAVLAEDLGTGGDLTSAATIDADAQFTAAMNAREPISVAGLEIAAAFFRRLDRDVEIEFGAADGDRHAGPQRAERPEPRAALPRGDGWA